jgi:hypothetical protein
MDHGRALTTKASERYLLGEMSEPERFDFESHYFSCEACAEDVRAGVVLSRGIKAVCAGGETTAKEPAREKAGWFDWLSPAALAPSLVAAALALVVGYQALVIPPRRAISELEAQEQVTLHAETRGEPPVVQVNRGSGLSILAVDVNVGEPGEKLTYQLLGPGGKMVKTGAAAVPSAGSQLLFPFYTPELKPTGVWTLILHPPDPKAAAERYPFVIK